MRLYFLRHGETDWNVERRAQGQVDIDLNEHGRELARQTCEGYKNYDIDLCISSPLSRAYETAQIVLNGRDVPIITDDRIKEVAFGEYEGIYVSGPKCDECVKDFDKFFSDPEHYVAPSGAETINDLIVRATDFLQSVINHPAYQDKSILISTHGAILRALVGVLQGKIKTNEFFDTPVTPNCATTIFDIDENGHATMIDKDVIFYDEKPLYWIIGDKE